uniref:Uncharacterized protein n=1 Tax=Romanomermis culicivorax TaxID=13658 RepID=A0A915IEE3_ROMCU
MYDARVNGLPQTTFVCSSFRLRIAIFAKSTIPCRIKSDFDRQNRNAQLFVRPPSADKLCQLRNFSWELPIDEGGGPKAQAPASNTESSFRTPDRNFTSISETIRELYEETFQQNGISKHSGRIIDDKSKIEQLGAEQMHYKKGLTSASA